MARTIFEPEKSPEPEVPGLPYRYALTRSNSPSFVMGPL